MSGGCARRPVRGGHRCLLMAVVLYACVYHTHVVTALVTCGYSIGRARLQPWLHAATASVTCGYNLGYKRSQPRSRAVTALVTVTCGRGLGHMRLQPWLLTVMILYCPDVVLYCPSITLYYCSDIIDYTSQIIRSPATCGYMRLRAVTYGHSRRWHRSRLAALSKGCERTGGS